MIDNIYQAIASTGLFADLRTASNLVSGDRNEYSDAAASDGSGNGDGRRRPPRTPKGRQVDPAALDEVRALLTDRPRRRDLLIEHLHLIQDHYGHLSAAHLAALAAEMKMALTEVYEVATFYSHFDVVKDGPPPPAVTVRVCDSLSCAMAGAEELLKKLPGNARQGCARGARALHGRLRPRAGRAPSAICRRSRRRPTRSPPT